MPKGIRAEIFIRREDGHDVSLQLHEKIVRKIVALLQRLGCTVHGEWRPGEPDGVEDLLG